jgi:aspartate aminotransferase
MLKDIIKNLEPSSTLRINEVSKRLEDEGKKIFKFGFGQSPFEIPTDIVNALKNNAHQNKYLLLNIHLKKKITIIIQIMLLLDQDQKS